MRWLFVAMLAVAGAVAAPLNQVVVGDLQGTNGKWQAGEVTVAVPAAEVTTWFTDVKGWSARFPDDSKVRDGGRTPDGRQIADFHSDAIGKTLHLEIRQQPGLITYVGKGKDVNTQGKIFIQSLGPNTTRVIMQTTGEVHGVSGAFAGENTKRKRAIKKLTADLNALVHLSNNYAATQRHGG
jgi:hypothetical protein